VLSTPVHASDEVAPRAQPHDVHGAQAATMPGMTALRTAVVLEPGPQSSVVAVNGRRTAVGCSAPFGARAAELRPGHLVALAPGDLVVWRWFDAVVLEVLDGEVRL
jgi:hypothetical protein